MTDAKTDRLGMRGRIGQLESALRLIGGANATGAIASGAAFHAFAENVAIQGSIKTAAILFLFGIFTFVIASMGLFMMTLDIDHSCTRTARTRGRNICFGSHQKARRNIEQPRKYNLE
jgi:hypothetical protein